jgi:hypothetical protein
MEGCLVMGNSAFLGGGIFDGSLGAIYVNNCTLVENSASYGGGVFAVTNLYVNNCIIYFNTAAAGSNYYSFELNHSFLNHCCTAPQPGSGYAQAVITSDPLFIDLTGGNLRLQSNSPCIDTGNNAYLTDSTDLHGNPRIRGGTVDIGAYEFQAGASSIAPPLGIALSAQKAILTWPLWGSNFVLQAAAGMPSDSSGWSTVGAPVTVTNDSNVSSVPLGSGTKFFRLRVP